MKNRSRAVLPLRPFPLRLITLLLLPLLLWMAGCSGGKEESPAKPVLRVAEQYGLAYAPLALMRRTGVLEEALPGYRIEWVRLQNTAAIREAVLADQVDMGFMGIPPFLIGRDRGMEWKIFTALSEAPLGLVTWRSDLERLEDIGSGDRIALPQPGSIQHILLTMAARDRLGRADYYDNQLITLSHPDGMQALLARKEVAAHFTSPPYLMRELEEEDTRLLLTGREAMGGPFTFIVGAVTESFAAENPAALTGFRQALVATCRAMKAEPAEYAAILAEEYGLPAAELERYLKREDALFAPPLKGLDRFIAFMTEQGYLKKTLPPREVLLEGSGGAQL